jgi:Tfp pilus assembly protein FimT
VRTKRKGTSLFEIIVVMAIVLIAVAIAVPSLQSMMGDTPVKAAADQVKSRWAEARAKAIEQGKPYRFQITDSNRYRVAPDDDFDGDGGLNDKLPQDVSFGTPENGSQDGNVSILFLPDGTATSDIELPLNGQGCAPVTLKLNKTTGATR